MAPNSDTIAKAVRDNIEIIARLEQEFDRRRTVSDRIADAIGSFSGTMTFVVLHAIFIGAWILVNARVLPVCRPFDPYPFMLLSSLVSIEGIFLATFVLIKQSRMSRRADERGHLDLQINLLAEREMTLVLQMLQSISKQLGVWAPEEELRELAEETPVEAVASELQKAIGPQEVAQSTS